MILFLLAIVTLAFLCISFFAPVTENISENILYAYGVHHVTFLMTYHIFFFFGFLILLLAVIYSNYSKKLSTLKIYLVSFAQASILIVTCLLFSFILLFIIAFMQLNTLSGFINISPTMLGIYTDSNIIVERLKNSRRSPEIIATDREQGKILRAVAMATSGTNNFYGNSILSAIPSYVVIPLNKLDTSIVLIDNTLIVTEITSTDMQQISRLIGYLFVKNYFQNRVIKSFPTISLMDRREYLTYRKEDAEEKIKKIDVTIDVIDEFISSLSASLATEEKKDVVKEKLLEEYNYYLDFFRTQRTIVAQAEGKIPHELGVFKPKDTIKIVFDTKNPHAIADYFETVTHEYLHYASYVSDEQKFTNSFFEEGLTEYFARNAISETLHVSTNLGYPLQIAVIREMTNLLPESELAEIYFTKDEIALEKAMDRVYGDDFYANNQVIFETLQYTSDPRHALKLVNEIMARIGGKPLTEKDLVSSYSNL